MHQHLQKVGKYPLTPFCHHGSQDDRKGKDTFHKEVTIVQSMDTEAVEVFFMAKLFARTMSIYCTPLSSLP